MATKKTTIKKQVKKLTKTEITSIVNKSISEAIRINEDFNRNIENSIEFKKEETRLLKKHRLTKLRKEIDDISKKNPKLLIYIKSEFERDYNDDISKLRYNLKKPTYFGESMKRNLVDELIISQISCQNIDKIIKDLVERLTK